MENNQSSSNEDKENESIEVERLKQKLERKEKEIQRMKQKRRGESRFSSHKRHRASRRSSSRRRRRSYTRSSSRRRHRSRSYSSSPQSRRSYSRSSRRPLYPKYDYDQDSSSQSSSDSSRSSRSENSRYSRRNRSRERYRNSPSDRRDPSHKKSTKKGKTLKPPDDPQVKDPTGKDVLLTEDTRKSPQKSPNNNQNSSEQKEEETTNPAGEKVDDTIVPLELEVLEAIGKRLDAEKEKGPAIHNDILLRWNDILREGLPREETKELLKKYATPENCGHFEPPKLNLEIKASLLEPLIKRDTRMMEKQQKVTVCLAALGTLLTRLSKKEEIDKIALISTLSDTTRLLVDLQRDETLARRLIILSNLNPSMKETLNATRADKWLFNKDLGETLRTAKSLEKSSHELKPVKKPQTIVAPKASKNVKGPPRQQSRQTGTRGPVKSSHQQRSSSNYRKQSSGRVTRSSHRKYR